jgi:magnesium-transporting ATPase (P-type)
MKNPMVYKIGIEWQCFSIKRFIKWVMYAFWHAAVVYMISFYAVGGTSAF